MQNGVLIMPVRWIRTRFHSFKLKYIFLCTKCLDSCSYVLGYSKTPAKCIIVDNFLNHWRASQAISAGGCLHSQAKFSYFCRRRLLRCINYWLALAPSVSCKEQPSLWNFQTAVRFWIFYLRDGQNTTNDSQVRKTLNNISIFGICLQGNTPDVCYNDHFVIIFWNVIIIYSVDQAQFVN